jgi:hypothetical protein
MNRRLSRRRAIALAGGGLAALAGCVGGGNDARSDAESGNGNGNGGNGGGNGGDGSGNSGNSGQDDVGLPLEEREVPLERSLEAFESNAISGGPGKDGIPSIDDPTFGGPDKGDEMLDPGDPVFGVVVDGEARAYPQHVLVWHEIVNDEFPDRNLAITYCPLTGTAIGFERGSVEFGVSGMLVNNNLIMYDRETDSWWSQVLGTGILGELQGNALREVRVIWTSWERWRETHPETKVLTESTGYARNYGGDPYGGSYNPRNGYYGNDQLLFDNLHEDDRYDRKEVFIGARSADGAVAFHKDRLREDRLLRATVGDVPYLAAYGPTLDTAYVYRNPEGAEFEPVEDGYEGPDGTHAAAELPIEPVNAFDAMWFAWVAFYPETVVVA